MLRQIIPLLFFALLNQYASAQTEEPMQYVVTVPVGVSLTLGGTLTMPANVKNSSGVPAAGVPAAGVPVVLLIAGSGPTDRDCNSAPGLKTDAFRMLADSLSRQGVAVARYDKRYSGANRFVAAVTLPEERLRFDHYVSDAVGFIRRLQADKRFSRVIVAGHSEGSLVGMLAARQTNAAGFISIAGAGRNIADVMKTQGRAANPPALQAEVNSLLDSLRSGHLVHPANPLLRASLKPSVQPYLISWMRLNPATELRQFRGPVLLINGKRDFQVAVSEAEALKAARPDARLLLYDAMTHVLKDAASDSMADQAKTYTDPTLPLTPGLATAIAQFVKQL